MIFGQRGIELHRGEAQQMRTLSSSEVMALGLLDRLKQGLEAELAEKLNDNSDEKRTDRIRFVLTRLDDIRRRFGLRDCSEEGPWPASATRDAAIQAREMMCDLEDSLQVELFFWFEMLDDVQGRTFEEADFREQAEERSKRLDSYLEQARREISRLADLI